MSFRAHFVTVLLVAACGGDDDDLDPTPNGGGPECGGTPPVIEEFLIEDAGLSEGEACGGSGAPQVRLRVRAEDDDRDLDFVTLRAWVGPPGTVDGEGEFFELAFSDVGERCEIGGVNLTMLLCVGGSRVPPSTDLDFGVVVYDYLDLPSNDGVPVVEPYRTPAMDGSYR